MEKENQPEETSIILNDLPELTPKELMNLSKEEGLVYIENLKNAIGRIRKIIERLGDDLIAINKKIAGRMLNASKQFEIERLEEKRGSILEEIQGCREMIDNCNMQIEGITKYAK